MICQLDLSKLFPDVRICTLFIQKKCMKCITARIPTTKLRYESLLKGKSTQYLHHLKTIAMAKKEGTLTPIGKESFVFFVNAQNEVKGLTVDEIKGIYSGKITNWKDVGGKNKEIRAFQRPEDSGSQTALQKLMGDVPIMDPPVENVIDLMGGIIAQVSTYQNYNNAIGYTFRYYSTEMVQCKINT